MACRWAACATRAPRQCFFQWLSSDTCWFRQLILAFPQMMSIPPRAFPAAVTPAISSPSPVSVGFLHPAAVSHPSAPCFNLAVWHRKMLSLHPWRRGPGGCTVSPAPVHHPDAAALCLRDINRTTSDLVQDEWKKDRKTDTSPVRTQQQLQRFLMQNVLSVHMKAEKLLKWKIGEMCTAAANGLALHKTKVETACRVLSISISFV